jgi:hypothetical protein
VSRKFRDEERLGGFEVAVGELAPHKRRVVVATERK